MCAINLQNFIAANAIGSEKYARIVVSENIPHPVLEPITVGKRKQER